MDCHSIQAAILPDKQMEDGWMDNTFCLKSNANPFILECSIILVVWDLAQGTIEAFFIICYDTQTI